MSPIQCCEFQTTKLLIDDSQEFQFALSFCLPPEKGPYQFMTNPLESLKCLQKQTPLLDVRQPEANLKKLRSYADNPNEIDKIGVVFIDYSMPSLTGLEVFEQVQPSCSERILLTAMTDEKIAAQAFNRGLINQYISKQDPNLTKTILEAIKTGQKKYFQCSTQDFFTDIIQNEPDTALRDPAFIQFFSALKEKLGIVAYFLLDFIGSFLMLDSNKTRYKLTLLKTPLSKEQGAYPIHESGFYYLLDSII